MLGDKGNFGGSAGASNYAGDGMGGQVNLDHVGGGSGNVLRNIGGKWTIVSRSTGKPVGHGSGQAPIAAPIVRPVTPAVPSLLAPSVPLDPQIMGRLQQALAPKATGLAGASAGVLSGAGASASAYPNSMPGNSNAGLQYGAGTVNAVPRATGGLLGNMNPPHSLTPRTAGTTYQGEGMPVGWGQQAFEGGPAAPSSLGMQAPGNMNPPHTPTPNRDGFIQSPFSNPMRYMPGAPGANSAPATSGEYLAENFGQGPQSNTYSGPKGVTSLNDAARLAVARAAGYTGGLNQPSQADVDAMSRMMTAESGSIKNQYGNMSIPGATAVGSVIANRMVSAPYQGTLQEVLRQPGQFSPSQAELAAQNPSFAVNDVARSILSGEQPSNVGSALNYGNLDTIMNKPGYSSAATKKAFGSMEPVATFADANNPNTFQHTFGTIGQPASQVMTAQRATPTPMAAPQTMADNAPSLWESLAPTSLKDKAAQAAELVKAGYATYTDANKKIEKYGGAENVVRLAKMAEAISNFLPGGTGSRGATKNTDQRGQGFYKKNEDKSTDTPATPSVTPPTVNPTPPMWYYPQYTQAWANLPTGLGGPVWKPKPPSAGLFATKDETKGGRKKRGAVA